MRPRPSADAILIVGLSAGWISTCSLAPAPAAVAEEARGWRGFLAVRGETVLVAQNAERLFTPASVLKLVVTAAALHHLGPEYRATTRLRAAGVRSGGTLRGDLVVEAAGDPTWSERFFEGDPHSPLKALAQQLRQRGVGRIEGDLVVDVRRFPGRRYPLSRPLSEAAYGYAAPTSALAVDDNAVPVEIAPAGRVGDPGTAKLATSAGALRIVGGIRTVSQQRHCKGTVDFQPVWGTSTIVVRGEYPVSEPPYRIPIAVPDGDLHAGRELAAALREQGIELAGEVRLSVEDVTGPGPPPGEVLARFDSPPLSAWLEVILTDSSNWHAEMLLRLLAAEVLGEGRIDEGLELERRFLEEQVGLAAGSFDLDYASGLLALQPAVPRSVVALLRYVHRQPWGAAFRAALATPGRGTLEIWPDLPSISAKTGMIRNTVALAGYLAAGDDPTREPIAFACFLNHRLGDRGRMRSEITELVRRWRGLGSAPP